jgi:hypothetical protein
LEKYIFDEFIFLPKIGKKNNYLIILGIIVIEIEKNHVRASPPMLAGYLVLIG